MNNLKEYIIEKFKINKDNVTKRIVVKSRKELLEIIGDRFKWDDKVIDFNDIDVSNIKDMSNLFSNLDFINIDISSWDVSNVKTMRGMFNNCKHLRSTGDLSGWDVSNVIDMSFMFNNCEHLKNIGDLKDWEINGTKMAYAFQDCKQLKTIGPIEHWRPKESNWEIFPLCDLKPKPRSRV